MVTLAEIEAQATEWSAVDRATLATHLLGSLPSLMENDDGVAEALRRREEMEKDPTRIISRAQLHEAVGR